MERRKRITSLQTFSHEKVCEEELHPYKDAPGTYANFFDIKSTKELSTLERELSSVRQAELLSEIPTISQLSIPDYLYQFSTLILIHKRLFEDLYPWAGKIRGFEMGLGYHRFTQADSIIHYGEKVFSDFKAQVEQGFDDQAHFVKETAHFLNLINMLHPFPDGNGRTQRNIINLHLNYHGFELKWAKIQRWEIYETLKQAFEANDTPLVELFHKHLQPLSENGV
jgi:cell filamentation protein